MGRSGNMLAPPPMMPTLAAQMTQPMPINMNQSSGNFSMATATPLPLNAATNTSVQMTAMAEKMKRWRNSHAQQLQTPINTTPAPQVFQPSQQQLQFNQSQTRNNKAVEDTLQSQKPLEDDDEDEDHPADAVSHKQQATQSQRVSDPEYLQKYQTEINLTIDSLRRDLLAVRGDFLKINETVRNLSPATQTNISKMQESQSKIMMDQNMIRNSIQELEMMSRAIQIQFDEFRQQQEDAQEEKTQSTPVVDTTGFVKPDDLEHLLVEFEEEYKEAMHTLREEVRRSVQNISDRTHFIFASVLHATAPLLETPQLSARSRGEVPQGTKVCLVYPQSKTREGVFLKARTVGEDGAITISWIPIWTFTKEVLDKHAGDTTPPPEEAKVIYLGKFTTC
jgi:hypothetical protein